MSQVAIDANDGTKGEVSFNISSANIYTTEVRLGIILQFVKASAAVLNKVGQALGLFPAKESVKTETKSLGSGGHLAMLRQKIGEDQKKKKKK